MKTYLVRVALKGHKNTTDFKVEADSTALAEDWVWHRLEQLDLDDDVIMFDTSWIFDPLTEEL